MISIIGVEVTLNQAYRKRVTLLWSLGVSFSIDSRSEGRQENRPHRTVWSGAIDVGMLSKTFV